MGKRPRALAHADVTLNDCADAGLAVVDAILAAGSGPVMVVGHSMSGIAVTAVAERAPEKIALQVYLAAFMPCRGTDDRLRKLH